MIQAIEHLNPDTLSAFIDGELPDGEQEAIPATSGRLPRVRTSLFLSATRR